MSVLVLELRQGDVLLINGARIRFVTKARIELAGRAMFLFGKQIMTPVEADSPARLIYLAIQSAYVGADEERSMGMEAARQLTAEFKAATTSVLARDILDSMLACAEADDCYAALKLARRIVRHEDAVLGRTQPDAKPPAQRAARAVPPVSAAAPRAWSAVNGTLRMPVSA